MPQRLALIGLQRPGLTDSSAVNPARVKPHRVSTPPVMTTSHSPARSSLAALAMAFAPDEQAVDTTSAGPASPSSPLSASAGEPSSCMAKS